MTDVAASTPSASFTAVLALTPAADASGVGTPAVGGDPFAALIASVSGPTQPVVPATLAAPVRPLLSTPATTPLAQASAVSVQAPLPPVTIQTKPMPRLIITSPPDAGTPTSGEGGANSLSAETELKAPEEKQSDDPLGDAIASGATAVLALAPDIVQPVMAAPAQPMPDTMIPADPAAPPPGATVAAAAVSSASPALAQRRTISPAQSDARTDTQDDLPQHQPQQTDSQASNVLPDPILKAVLAKLSPGAGREQAVQAEPENPAALSAEAANVSDRPDLPLPRRTAAEPAQSPSLTSPPPRSASEAVSPHLREANEPTPPEPTRKGEKTEQPAAALAPPPAAQPAQDAAKDAKVAVSAAVNGDAVVQQTLSIARDGAWLDRLARDIAGSAGNDNQLNFRLNPENLGALSVSITRHAEGAAILMTADKEATRTILLDAQPSLIAEARAQGLHISDARVELSPNQSQPQPQAQDQPQKQGQNNAQSQTQSQNQSTGQDASRWAQGNSGHNGAQQNGQNRHSSPAHQPFVSNLGRKSGDESEKVNPDSNTLYA